MASVGWRVSDERSSGNRPFTSTASSRRGQSFGFRTGVAARSNPVAVFHEKTESPGSGKSHQLCLEARRFTGIRRLRRIVRTRAVQPGRLPGGIAQLVEHLLCKQKVTGSSPVASTSLRSPRSGERRLPRRSRPRACEGLRRRALIRAPSLRLGVPPSLAAQRFAVTRIFLSHGAGSFFENCIENGAQLQSLRLS